MAALNTDKVRSMLRRRLRDYPEGNDLLGDFETDDIQLGDAITLAASRYNSEPPITSLSIEDIAAANLIGLLDLAMIESLLPAALKYERNRLNVNDGGVVAVLDDKLSGFMAIIGHIETRALRQLDAFKRSQNLESAYGEISSEFATVDIWY